jgi:hypothetical protein
MTTMTIRDLNLKVVLLGNLDHSPLAGMIISRPLKPAETIGVNSKVKEHQCTGEQEEVRQGKNSTTP